MTHLEQQIEAVAPLHFFLEISMQKGILNVKLIEKLMLGGCNIKESTKMSL